MSSGAPDPQGQESARRLAEDEAAQSRSSRRYRGESLQAREERLREEKQRLIEDQRRHRRQVKMAQRNDPQTQGLIQHLLSGAAAAGTGANGGHGGASSASSHSMYTPSSQRPRYHELERKLRLLSKNATPAFGTVEDMDLPARKGGAKGSGKAGTPRMVPLHAALSIPLDACDPVVRVVDWCTIHADHINVTPFGVRELAAVLREPTVLPLTIELHVALLGEVCGFLGKEPEPEATKGRGGRGTPASGPQSSGDASDDDASSSDDNSDEETSESEGSAEGDENGAQADTAPLMACIPHESLLSRVSWQEVLRLVLLHAAPKAGPTVPKSTKRAMVRVARTLAAAGYEGVDASSRAQVLDVLVELCSTAPAVRGFMDQRMEQRLSLERERQKELHEERKEDAARRRAARERMMQGKGKGKGKAGADAGKKSSIDAMQAWLSAGLDDDGEGRADGWKQSLRQRREEAVRALRGAMRKRDLASLRQAIDQGAEVGLETGRRERVQRAPVLEEAYEVLKSLKEERKERIAAEQREHAREKRAAEYESQLRRLRVRNMPLGVDGALRTYWVFGGDEEEEQSEAQVLVQVPVLSADPLLQRVAPLRLVNSAVLAKEQVGTERSDKEGEEDEEDEEEGEGADPAPRASRRISVEEGKAAIRQLKALWRDRVPVAELEAGKLPCPPTTRGQQAVARVQELQSLLVDVDAAAERLRERHHAEAKRRSELAVTNPFLPSEEEVARREKVRREAEERQRQEEEEEEAAAAAGGARRARKGRKTGKTEEQEVHPSWEALVEARFGDHGSCEVSVHRSMALKTKDAGALERAQSKAAQRLLDGVPADALTSLPADAQAHVATYPELFPTQWVPLQAAAPEEADLVHRANEERLGAIASAFGPGTLTSLWFVADDAEVLKGLIDGLDVRGARDKQLCAAMEEEVEEVEESLPRVPVLEDVQSRVRVQLARMWRDWERLVVAAGGKLEKKEDAGEERKRGRGEGEEEGDDAAEASDSEGRKRRRLAEGSKGGEEEGEKEKEEEGEKGMEEEEEEKGENEEEKEEDEDEDEDNEDERTSDAEETEGGYDTDDVIYCNEVADEDANRPRRGPLGRRALADAVRRRRDGGQVHGKVLVGTMASPADWDLSLKAPDPFANVYLEEDNKEGVVKLSGLPTGVTGVGGRFTDSKTAMKALADAQSGLPALRAELLMLEHAMAPQLEAKGSTWGHRLGLRSSWIDGIRRLKAVEDAKEPLIALEEAIHALQADRDAESGEEEDKEKDEDEDKEDDKGKKEEKKEDAGSGEGKSTAAAATTSSGSSGSAVASAKAADRAEASAKDGALDDELTEEEGVEQEAAAAAAKQREAGSGGAGGGAEMPEDEEDVVQDQGDHAATVRAHSWQPSQGNPSGTVRNRTLWVTTQQRGRWVEAVRGARTIAALSLAMRVLYARAVYFGVAPADPKDKAARQAARQALRQAMAQEREQAKAGAELDLGPTRPRRAAARIANDRLKEGSSRGASSGDASESGGPKNDRGRRASRRSRGADTSLSRSERARRRSMARYAKMVEDSSDEEEEEEEETDSDELRGGPAPRQRNRPRRAAAKGAYREGDESEGDSDGPRPRKARRGAGRASSPQTGSGNEPSGAMEEEEEEVMMSD